MVAVIAGNGLGLGNTSLTQLGQSQGGSPSLGQAGNRGYVNTATGNLVLQSADEGLLFDGLPLNVLRTYNSLGQLSSSGWSYGFSRNLSGLTGTLNTAGSTITRTGDDGSSVVYTFNATLGVYVSTAQNGAVDTLSWNATSSTWTWTDSTDSLQEMYNATGQLTALTNTGSGASYSFSYSNGQLGQIMASDGDTLLFGYNTSHQLISLSIQEIPPGQSTAVTRQAVSYGYDSQGRLTSVTTTLASDTDSSTTASYTSTYTYQGTTDLISSVTQSDGTTVSYTYTQDAQGVYQVTGVTTGSGSAAQTIALSYGTHSTTVTDGLGDATTYQTNAQGQLTSVIAPAVNGSSSTTTYTYDANGNLLTSTDPNGAVTTHVYDANGNLLSVEDGAGNTISYTYNAAEQITSKTTYTVPAQGVVGQSAYVAPSSAQTSYYVYNATNQLAYSIDALGAVTEHDYSTVNGLSELTTTRQYLGATYSTSSNSPSSPPTLAQLQTWVQSTAVQNTLSQSTRTDYVYDVRGQLATQTQYDTVNSSGVGVLTNGTVITTTTYDVQGRLLQASTETGASRSTLQTTTYAYDGMGRMISKTDPLGNVTSYVYVDNGSNDTLMIMQANGLTTTQVRNSAGQLISSTQSSSTASSGPSTSITRTSLAISLGSTSTTTTTASIAYQSYYITHSDGTGQWMEGEFVTTTVRSAQNNAVLYSRLYAMPLTAAQMAQLAASPAAATLQPMLATSASDQINLTIYASNGQQQAQVQYGTYNFTNPDGSTAAVTGELVTTQATATQAIRYATPLTVAQLDTLGNTPTLSALQALLTSSANDQTTLNAVDSSSTGVRAGVSFGTYKNASGVVAAGEFIWVSQSTSSGVLTALTHYATPLTAAQVSALGSSPTVAQIQALITTSGSDQTSLFAHDNSGKPLSQVIYLDGKAIGQNADGTIRTMVPGEYLEVFHYNSAGVRTGYTIYATPLTASQLSSLGTAPTDSQIQALIATSADDFSFVTVFDANNRAVGNIQTQVLPVGGVLRFGYYLTIVSNNSVGQQTMTLTYATPLSASQVASLGSSATLAQAQALVTSSNSDLESAEDYNAQGGMVAWVTPTKVTTTLANGTSSTNYEELASVDVFDGQGRVVGVTNYATPVSISALEALGSQPTLAQLQALVTASSGDQTSLTIYNADRSVNARVNYETHYFTNADGTVSTVTGEFVSLNQPGGGSLLYKTPLTTAQMALLEATPTPAVLQAILAGNIPGRTTTYAFDSAGRPTSVTDPNGHTSYTLYNAENELAYSVDADGNVTGYTRDADGQVIGTVHYGTPLTTSQLATLAATPTVVTLQGLLTTGSSDRTTTTIYNAAGQVVATIDPANYVTTITYDGTGNVLATTQYATSLTAAQRSALGSHPTFAALQADLTNNAGNRTALTIYDADGRAAANIDAQGFVTVTAYDDAGDVVRQTAYATALTSSQLGNLGNNPTLAAVQADLTTSAQDQTLRTYYDEEGRVVATFDADGYLTTTAYDETTDTITTTRYTTALTSVQLGVLTGSESVTALVGLLGSNTTNESSHVTTNGDGQVISRTAVDGTVTTYTYNSVGQVLSTTVTPASGQGTARTTSATYDAFGETLTSTDAASATTTYVYNALGQVIEASDANGNSAWTYYDADGKVLYTIQSQPQLTGNGMNRNYSGNVTAYSYNAFGEVISTTTYAASLILTTGTNSGSTLNPTGATVTQIAAAIAAMATVNGDANAIISTTYTLDGQVATVTDGDGYQAARSYDAFGDVTQVQQQLSQPGSALNAGNSTTTTYTYDTRGERLSDTDGVGTPAARTTSAIYDAFGRVISRTDGNGNTVAITYDDLGRQVATSQTVQGTARTTQTTYDAFGQVLTETDALGNVTTYSYNIATHTTTASTPSGVTTTTIKDAYGNTVSVADGRGNATKYTYDADGRLLTTTDALGNVSHRQYDADGNLTLTTDANGNEVIFSYDADGRLVDKQVDPNGLDNETTYTYDGQGRELYAYDPVGTATKFTYDAAGNVLSKAQDAGTGTLNQTTTYTYDGNGKVLTETQGAGSSVASTTQYVYDSLGRLSRSIVDPTGLDLVTSYSYDANGNRIATTDPNGNTSFTIYNEANEVVYRISAAGASGSGLSAVTQYWYDADGNVVSTRVYANLVSSSSLTGLNTDTTAQALGAGASLAASAATGSDAVSYDVYNADGQPNFHVDPMGNVTETRYNTLGQVAETLAYATPIVLSGTLVSALQAGTARAPDMQGALQQAGNSDSTARTSYSYYDADGRVVYTVTPNMVNGVLAGVVSQTQYDAVGQVVADIVYGVPLPMADLGAGSTTASIAQAVAQLNAAATTRTTQYFYDAAGNKVAEVDPNGQASYTFYDANSRVIATVDALGAVVTYTRDALGRVTQETAYSTKLSTSGWLVNGKVTQKLLYPPAAAPGYDRSTVTSYDTLGRIASVTHYSQVGSAQNGDTLNYVYDSDSRVVQTTGVDLGGLAANRVTNYFYDKNGNNIARLDADGYLTTYAYDAAGQLTQTVAYATKVAASAGETLAQLLPASTSKDQVTTNYYDARGNRVGTLDADGCFTQYTYDLNDDRVTTTRYAKPPALGISASYSAMVQALAGTASHQTIVGYDSYGEIVSSQDYQGTVTTRAYDDLGNVIQETVAAGTADARTTSSKYDAFGNLLSYTDGLGNVTTYTYDLAGNKASATDADGNTTWYVYDPENRLIYTIRGVDDGTGIKNSSGEVAEQDYDVFGDVVSTVAYSARLSLGTNYSPTLASVAAAVAAIVGKGTDADDKVGYTYDLEGNVTAKTDANGNTFTYTYDGFNDRSSKADTAWYRVTSDYTYDNLGHMLSEVDEVVAGSGGQGITLLRTQDWTYDALGNMVTYTDGDGATTSYGYDNLNQRLTQSLVVAGAVRESFTSYDAYGRVLSSTDAMGQVTTFSYNDTARSLTMTSPGGVSTTTTYNREGQKIAIADAAGNTTSYQYDADGNLLKKVNPDGSSVSNQYDAVGDLIHATDADGNVVTYAYDAAGRVLTETADPNGLKLVTTYTYDGRGLTLSKTDPAGVVTNYQYDGNGNLSYMDQNAGKPDIQTTYVYNELNELTSSSSKDNANTAADAEVNSYSYDALGHLASESLDTGKVGTSDYTYDADGRVTSRFDGLVTTYYYYDEAGEPVYAISTIGGRFIPGDGGIPPNGAATQTWYNADGQAVGTTQYATQIPYYELNNLTSGGSTYQDVAAAITPSVDDRSSYAVYNADGKLQYSIDATGAVTENVYNSNGQLSETLAYANPIVVSAALASALQAGAAKASDVASALASVGDSSANARITYTYYDQQGRPSLVISVASLNSQSGGLVKQIQYDANGNIVAQIQYGDLIPLSQVGGGASTASISLYLASDTNVHVTRSVYDAAGRKVYSIDAGNNVTETQYDADGRVTWTLQYANPIAKPASWGVVDVAVAVQTANSTSTGTRGTENVYDAFGNVIETFSKASGTSPTAVYAYNGRGLKTSYTDASGNTWAYAYDPYGNLIQQTSPPVAVASYNANGVYQGTITESVVTSYRYDGGGNLIGETDASNTSRSRSTSYIYDSAGNLTTESQLDPGAFNPQTGLIANIGSRPTVRFTYSAFNQAVISQDAKGNYAYDVYDADGRLTYAVDGNGYVTGYTYDAYGDQTAVTRYASPLDVSALTNWSPGQPLTMTLMGLGLVTSSADRTITTTYDAQGNKLSVTEPVITYTKSDGTTSTGSPVTQYTYDAYGNVTSQSVLVQGTPGQAGAAWATTYNYYDALGHRIMTVDPMGFVTTDTYDAFGDLVANTQYATAINASSLVAGGTPPALPPAGNAATTGLDRVTNYTYDNNGNKTSVSVRRSYVNAQGQSVVGFDTTTYGYDADNRLTTVTENGSTVTTAYDALGRITSVTGPQVEVLVSNWQALLEANPSLTLASASLYTLASQVVSYSYDALGNKLVQTQSSTGSSQSVSTYYLYDRNGHVVAEMTPLDSSGLNWRSPQVKYMAYDSNGSLTSESYTLTGNDNVVTTVTTTYAYDGNNQQTSSVTSRTGIPSPDKVASTTYDAFGDVTASGDGATNSVVNTYDNAGNKLTYTDPKTGELHTYGYNLAGQRVSDVVPLAASVGGTVQTLYTLDLDGRIVAEQAPSTNATTGENAGILHATYDAWGNVLSSTDAKGNITTYTYNERNNVITETEASVTVAAADGTSAAATPIKTSSYDISGNLIASTDENGNVIKNAYNALGQKAESTDGAGAVLYWGYDALGNKVAQQDGNGNVTFSNVDALGRTLQSGEFELATGGGSRQAVWQQAYVLDQNGDRIVSYDGIGSAYLQSGDLANAALHANYDGYNSQGKVIWSQDAAQRAASTSAIHGIGNYGTGTWTQTPTNANFSNGTTGWTMDPGFAAGSFATTTDSTGATVPTLPPGSSGGTSSGGGVSPIGGGSSTTYTWSLEFTGTTNPNNGSGWAKNLDRVPVVAGQAITASAQFVVVGSHGGGAVQIIFYDANGNALQGTYNGDIVSAGRGVGTSTFTATAPAGAAYAAIGIACTNYNLADSTVYCSGVSWNYEPPAYITSLGLGNGSSVITLPSGSFTDQVTNSDFAQGNVGWNTNGWTIHPASNANSGWEASYGGNGSASMVNQDRVPVVPGQTISGLMRLSLYLAPQGAAASGLVAINWYDANGNLIKTDTGNLVNNDHKGAWETSSITATAPAGAAYASLAVIGTANGIGSVSVESVQWNYQYVPQIPTGVVQDTYVYDMDGNLISETTADGNTESWQYNAYGQVTQHTDLSGANYSYTYDTNTGAQIAESDNWSPAAQGQVAPSYVTAPLNTPNSETLTYYADGQIATEAFSDGSSYSYQYDANGNLIREEDTTVDGNNNTVHTVTQTSYDGHNRVSSVTETNVVTGATMLQENFSYDAAGNRREVKATSNGTTQDAWYTYDGDNRVLVADGALQSSQIVVTGSTGSYENAYDANGNVIQIVTKSSGGDTMSQLQHYNALNQLIETDYAVDVTSGSANNGVEKTTTYDGDGHALITQTYYELGATIQYNNGPVNVGGELESATVNFYDLVGRMAESQTFNTPSGWNGTTSPIPTGTPSPDATTYGSLALQSEVVYQGPNGTSGYSADGDVAAYQYRDNKGRVDQYQVNYLKKDGYLQATTSGTSNTTNVQPATDQTVYNSRGNEVALEQHNEDPYGNIADTVHVFAYNGSGQIIEREDGTATGGTTLNLGSNPNQEVQHYTYVNGQQLAHFDNAGTLDVLDQVTAFSNNNDSPNSYVVQTGDTLESIAQAEYGNANLWYVLAQANDLSGDTNLVLGQRLQIPAVTMHSNSATTFKPYDPSSIVGSTTPNLPTIMPPPPPASGHGCGVLGQIIMIAVMVVVSVMTGGVGGAILGSLVGQLVGDALGVHHGISLGELAMAAVSAGVAEGVGEALNGTALAAADAGQGLTFAGRLVQGAAVYVADDAVGKIVGEPEHFSWAGLVANGLANAVGGEFGPSPAEQRAGNFSTNGFENVASVAVGDVVRREVNVALGNMHVPSWEQVGVDVAGNALGNTAAFGIKAYEREQAQQVQQSGSSGVTTGTEAGPSHPPIDLGRLDIGDDLTIEPEPLAVPFTSTIGVMPNLTMAPVQSAANPAETEFDFANNSSQQSPLGGNGPLLGGGSATSTAAALYDDGAGTTWSGSDATFMPFNGTAYDSWRAAPVDSLDKYTDAQLNAFMIGGDKLASNNEAGSATISPYAEPNDHGGFGPEPAWRMSMYNPAPSNTGNPVLDQSNNNNSWIAYLRYVAADQGSTVVDPGSIIAANEAYDAETGSWNQGDNSFDPDLVARTAQAIATAAQNNNIPYGAAPPAVPLAATPALAPKLLSTITVSPSSSDLSSSAESDSANSAGASSLPQIPLDNHIPIDFAAGSITAPNISIKDVLGQLPVVSVNPQSVSASEQARMEAILAPFKVPERDQMIMDMIRQQPVLPTRPSQSPDQSSVDTWQYVPPNFIDRTFHDAIDMARNPNAPIGDRLISGAAALLSSPLQGMNLVWEGALNAPFHASKMAEHLAQASLDSNPDDATMNRLYAFQEGLDSFLGFGGALTPLARVPSPNSVLRGTVTAGRQGVLVRAATGTYKLRSPIYLDRSPGRLNSGPPIETRTPLVKLEESEWLKGLKAPNRRHFLSSINQKTLAKERNTVIDPSVDVAGDVAAIRNGQGYVQGNTISVNGRAYGYHDGTLYPESGEGFYTLDRGAFKALGVYNKFGSTMRAEEILNSMKISEAARTSALEVWGLNQ
ncbi:LysM peptidoglycan-binding domain-containing protein [Dyella choica]|uniref:LysM peptidoglycan-binding domain-containing protein n=1 Tax=Dyella choica TaxID=1927959 RepID=A0A3S0PKC6_9GAMM|nr:LysM peptidoglycan-binding domain-containing protein [Dyella choica]RUL72743.1 LysM peptidoglycan-binding domain-containing protein [Dyella choica]